MNSVTPTPGFYGTDSATYFVAETGRVWLVQSDDVESGDLPREVDSLNQDAQPIDPRAIDPEELQDLLKGVES